MNGMKTKARIRVEKDVHLVLKNVKLKIIGQPNDEVLLMTDSRYKNYNANEDRISLKDGLLFWNYSGETVSVKYHQTLIPKQIVNKVLCSLHPGNAKTKVSDREEYYFPKNGAIDQRLGHVI